MAVQTKEEQIASYMNKIELAWKKWKDASITEAEKDTIESLMKKLLAKLPVELSKKFEWSKGMFVIAGRQQADGTKPNAGKAGQQQAGKATGKQEAKGKQEDARQAGRWTTKELTEYLSKLFGKPLTSKTVRRYLRTMDRYNDHVTTHYSWNGQNDPLVKEIVDFIKGKVGQSA